MSIYRGKLGLHWELLAACDGEVAGDGVLGAAGLGAAEGDGVFAGEDDVIALCVHLAERASSDGEADVFGFPGREMHAFKAGEDALWRFVAAWLGEVELGNLVAGA